MAPDEELELDPVDELEVDPVEELADELLVDAPPLPLEVLPELRSPPTPPVVPSAPAPPPQEIPSKIPYATPLPARPLVVHRLVAVRSHARVMVATYREPGPGSSVPAMGEHEERINVPGEMGTPRRRV